MKTIRLLALCLATFGLTSLSSSANAEDLLCLPDFDYSWEENTIVFDNLTICDGGIYCWYVDGVLQVIDPEFSWVPPGPGSYELCLNISYNGCSEWHCEDIEVTEDDCSPCHLNLDTHDCGDCTFIFSADPDFETEVTWLISDGTTFTGNVLLHTFDAPGTYTACATGTGDACPAGASECFTVTTSCESLEPCDPQAYQLVFEEDSCSAAIELVAPGGYASVYWTVDGADAGSGQDVLYLENSTTDWVTHYIEAVVVSANCPDGVTLWEVVSIAPCYAPCASNYALNIAWLDWCTYEVFVDGLENTDALVEWTVNGEPYTVEIGASWVLEADPGGGDYDITATFFDPECGELVTLDYWFYSWPCETDPCPEFQLISYQDTSNCQIFFEVLGWDPNWSSGITWNINNWVTSTDGNVASYDVFPGLNDVYVSASFFSESCGEEITLDASFLVQPCGDPCPEYALTAYQDTTCGVWLEIPELSNEPYWNTNVEWVVNGVSFVGDGPWAYYTSDGLEQTLVFEATFWSEACGELITVTEVVVLEGCGSDCDVYIETFTCFPELYMYGEGGNGQPVDWYVDDVFVGTGYEAFDIPSGSVAEVCGCVETAACGYVCECQPVDLWACYVPDFTLSVDGDFIHVELEQPSGEGLLLWEFYGMDAYQTSEAEVPPGFEHNGPGTYQVCAQSLQCPGGCPTCVSIVLEDESCLPFQVEIDFLDSIVVNEPTYWSVTLMNDAGAFLDSVNVTTVADVLVEDVVLDFCLPQGCYEAVVDYYVPADFDWASVDINLVGVNDQNVTYTGWSDVMQFGLGQDCGYDITNVEEPLAAFTMWPNPTVQTRVTVDLQTDHAALLEIRDIHGRVLQSIPRPNRREVLDTSGLRSGMYFVTVNTASGKRVTEKLQVNR